MRIPSFSIQNQRAIRLAACNQVPRIMVITGPNGCGKSTLLNGLRQISGAPGRTLYVGPHRTSRRQNVRMRFLGQQKIQMRSLLSAASLPGFEGMQLPSNDRDAWNYDEAQSFLKYSLCQIELDRQDAIASRYDQTGVVNRSEMPDVWTPLKELAHNLLPHLTFAKVDLSNRDQIRCLWRVHGNDLLVDIDELSSGEKAIIQLFYPLIEHQLNRNLALMRGTSEELEVGEVTVLMDEPELHLHPNLQAKILDYMRALSIKENTQFILATHSPSMVEHASSEELYLLRPAELLEGASNQLIKIADDDDKLNAMRSLFGSTSNVTALRKLLVVEGRASDKASRRPADARIYGFLSDRFGQVTVISGGGKSECASLVESLNSCMHSLGVSVRATALLDRDTVEGKPAKPDQVWLPVSMIENLLVDPDTIFHATETVRHKTDLRSVEEVARAIDGILDDMQGHEVARRVKSSVPAKTFRLSDPIDTARSQVEEFASLLLDEVSQERFEQIRTQAEIAVTALETARRRREFFDGKYLINTFFARYIHATGLSKEIFVYLCAKEAARRTSVSKFADGLFTSLAVQSSL